MRRHTEVASPPEQSERAALAKPGGPVVGSSRPFSVCGEPMLGRRTSACSNRCRAAKSRRRRTEAQTERDQRVRDLLTAALREVEGRR